MNIHSKAKGGLPLRLTGRQEAFAQHVARGESLAASYRQAGYRAAAHRVYADASNLAKTAKIIQRVCDIRADLEKIKELTESATIIVTAQTVSQMLAQVFTNATNDKQHGAAATAAMGLAKVHGLLVDKTEDVTRRATRDPSAPLEIDVDHWVTEQVPLLLEAAVKSPEMVANGGMLRPVEEPPQDDGSDLFAAPEQPLQDGLFLRPQGSVEPFSESPTTALTQSPNVINGLAPISDPQGSSPEDPAGEKPQ